MTPLAVRSCLLSLCIGFVAGASASADTISDSVRLLTAQIPASAIEFTPTRSQAINKLVQLLETEFADDAWRARTLDAQPALKQLERLLATKQAIDRELESVLALRVEFVRMPPGTAQKAALQNFLKVASALIDLSGRLRYALRDAIDEATYIIEPTDAAHIELLDVLIRYRSSIGASMLSFVLFDPDPASGFPPLSEQTRLRLLQLIRQSHAVDLLPDLAEFVRQETTSVACLLSASETIRELGLPQDPRPGQDADLPPPAITAAELHAILNDVDPIKLKPEDAARHRDLLQWLAERNANGVVGDTFRTNGYDLQAGDWLLMRNPSPYNLFTDLSPGLFTHVGIVTVARGSDGKRRFVLVDLPERGTKIPATNVDQYVERTLHYVFLRHQDLGTRKTMANAAATMIGNRSRFDLTFQTERVLARKGQPLANSEVHTYCAGFLLLCAQETNVPLSAFFPIAENAVGGHCPRNLSILGLSIGKNFVSPTGALFSEQMQIVGTRRPMYSPDREVREAVYDHFAESMVKRKLVPSPNTYQALRESLARMSKNHAWLSSALARANGVSERTDLEAAAKAAAVIETLDQIADGNRDTFVAARKAILYGSEKRFRSIQLSADRRQQLNELRQRHQKLLQSFLGGRISPRQLRIDLVEYYIRRGKQQLEDRFFISS